MSARWGRRSSPRTLPFGERGSCTARWEELELCSDGQVEATISATSYVVDGQARPVAFVWNGGPGASSSPLHLRALGPRILVDDVPVDNPHTLLDVADLVFVDPIGTGFSRLRRDEAASRWLSTEGDVAALEALIRAWLTAHDRLDARIHLVGESYGGFRLAGIAPALVDLTLGALVLVSPMLDATAVEEGEGNDLAAVFQLPTLAVAAWVHGKAGAEHDTATAVWQEAAGFAANELLPALHLGAASPHRASVARGIAARVGLPIEQVEAADLRLSSEDVLRTLLADEGLVVGRLDVRVTGPMPAPDPGGRPPAADDPALGLGRSNVIVSEPIATYLRDELGVQVDDDYVSLTLDVSFAWDWRPRTAQPPSFRTSVAPCLGSVLAERPDAIVLVIGGYHDLATPLAATVHAARHAGVPEASLRILALDAGHSLDESVLGEAHAAIVDVIVASTGKDDA